LAKIAAALHEALRVRDLSGASGGATFRMLASGDGWRVCDVICTSDPRDRAFEEQHEHVAIAVVVAGTFQYRTAARRELLTPGALLFGNPGQPYECSHDHGRGDRCISFQYSPSFFEQLLEAAARFRASRLPPLRASAPLIARACAAMAAEATASWETLAIEMAVEMTGLANDLGAGATATWPSRTEARVTRAIRAMEHDTDAAVSLRELAVEAGLSPFHFLRTFTRITGVTPHQFALRARLRDAALRLALDHDRIIDVALDSGFGDVSNFNRTFRAEFGVAPREYRRAAARASRVAPAR